MLAILSALPPLAALLILGACSRDSSNPAPQRVDAQAPIAALTSALAIPITADLDVLEARLNTAVPTTLWTIDEKRPDCVAAKRLTIKALGIKDAKVTPNIACRITGEAVRGRIRLGGKGDILEIQIPITAKINARDVDEKLAGETATAQALVTAKIRIDIDQQWQANAKADLRYKWLQEPSLKVLGISIGLEGPADKALAKLLPHLETEIPKQLAKIHTRDELAKLWARGFTSVEVNHENPEVWISLAPESLHVSPTRINGRTITLPVTLMVNAQTVIGHRPEDPLATPLPAPAAPAANNGVRLTLPVLADYAALEPVLKKALDKLAAKGVSLPKLGPVDLKFGKVTIYPVSGERIAVGVEVDAKASKSMVDTRGTIWLVGKPVNEAGSQRVTIKNLEIASRTDNKGFDLLVLIADMPSFKTTIAEALVQDFSKDLKKLMIKIEPKLAALPIGKSFILNARITGFENGQVVPLGQGLFMPVEARAEASLIFRPVPKSGPAPAKTASGPPSKTPPARS